MNDLGDRRYIEIAKRGEEQSFSHMLIYANENGQVCDVEVKSDHKACVNHH